MNSPIGEYLAWICYTRVAVTNIEFPFLGPVLGPKAKEARAQKAESRRRLFTPLRPPYFSTSEDTEKEWQGMNFQQKMIAILEHTPELTSILESAHAEDPEKITLLLSPHNNFMLARHKDKLLAINFEIMCSQFSAWSLFEHHAPFIRRATRQQYFPGYMIFQAPTDIPVDRFENYLKRAATSRSTTNFNFGQDISRKDALTYLALDVQALLSVDYHVSHEPRISERIHLPIPVKQPFSEILEMAQK